MPIGSIKSSETTVSRILVSRESLSMDGLSGLELVQ